MRGAIDGLHHSTYNYGMTMFDADGNLTPPSAYRVMAVCTQCGHRQYPYAINPEFNDAGDMVNCYVGSAGDFCDVCEERGADTALTMELVGYDLAAAYERAGLVAS